MQTRNFSNELERVLAGDSAAAPPSHILEGLDDELAQRQVSGAPHSIYGELWHIVFWQEMTLDWVNGNPTPSPAHATDGFPKAAEKESWAQLCERFFRGNEQAAGLACDAKKLERVVRCPSPAGLPERKMTVREQLESLAAHNAYHFGRIVLLRQLLGAWPPASGGSTW